jgi:hypothetical protein
MKNPALQILFDPKRMLLDAGIAFENSLSAGRRAAGDSAFAPHRRAWQGRPMKENGRVG